MKITVAKYAGFCPGVKRAWALVEEAAKKNQRQVFILGELIHNRQAIERLGEWGVETVKTLKEAREKNRGNASVVIRAHGEPPKTFERLRKQKIEFINATCPSVARVQQLANKLEDNGYLLIVCGERGHPEAKATVGYTKNGVIISSVNQAKKLPRIPKVAVICQTTFSKKTFEEICAVLQKKAGEFKFSGTICNFTQTAQQEARELTEKVDLIIVIGGRHSSNTKRLVEVASEKVKTYHIETKTEIRKRWFKGIKTVGILAGASTPDWIIKEVKDKIRKYD